ncbi:flagella basal body P-ring formation protein FlgA [Erwinia sp. OLTSP20]|uniref:flagellar basal body P-ring formation chaperone FlgA n=1 Tax=unclassified Erwinia TaxID=2622719 RepID=UPI000C176701|nr:MULTISPECIES: flagellar basal body P-ring formation chaperone FlgA [unclassified Erwinia]PIJ51918.1 flagella basal body P-ring formation protein FlgA [Erwinia sp. OAMSP11]PIJ74793.1 flagella basal body P-ring formation protein FlgA [Erwinia sp. OLSSP12]PIJ85179.1 flagella basal body P-ring formation protein FlgA [Erwinia sp. OLCASP19]PIJ87180.1 flagella basal body P-ring formation protein FlgA [Erwinia sp. OLMTSP26]PIJ88324.1 flagella basal body P-ring formation protein FlgA [Erwinia sp. OL
MNKLKMLAIAALGLLSLPVCASDLTSQLDQFFKARNGQNSGTVTVTVKTPQAQWPSCEHPQFSLPGNARRWGLISVAANCGHNRRYIQVEVQVTGDYVVAARQITRNTAVTAGDITIKKGRLDKLPARTAVSPDEVIGAISLRDIIAGQPVNMMMVRQPWRVKAGQNVMVTASGEGFTVTSEGRAMNNAAATQSVRVRMHSGQIVSGKVNDDGKILISL